MQSFEVIYTFHGKHPEMSYILDALCESEARRVADSWLGIAAKGLRVKRAVVRKRRAQ